MCLLEYRSRSNVVWIKIFYSNIVIKTYDLIRLAVPGQSSSIPVLECLLASDTTVASKTENPLGAIGWSTESLLSVMQGKAKEKKKHLTVPFSTVQGLQLISSSLYGDMAFPEIRGLGGDKDLISGAELGKSVFSLCMRMSALDGISFIRNCWTIGFLNHSMTESPGALRTTLLTSNGDSTEFSICATTIFRVGPVTNLIRLGTTP